MLRCAVLDDYQDAARSLADWSGVELTVFRAHMSNEDEVAAALADFDVVVIMRERTPFPATLLDRLPRLRLLITSGMRNASIDLAATARNGVTVCGTASRSEPPVELTWALILGLCRHLVPENVAFRSGGPWQSTIGTDLAGATLTARSGQDRHPGRHDRSRLRHGSPGVEPEPDRRTLRGRRRVAGAVPA
jgi:phosphoglycerate dehydrogenase-like enzyme